MDDVPWDRISDDFPGASNLCLAQYAVGGGETAAPRPVSTSSDVRVGYFARLAQVSHLLGLVLNNKYNPTPDDAFNVQEVQQLRRALAVYADLLPREGSAVDCAHYCGAVAICQR